MNLSEYEYDFEMATKISSTVVKNEVSDYYQVGFLNLLKLSVGKPRAHVYGSDHWENSNSALIS